jgi:hypothetical protein
VALFGVIDSPSVGVSGGVLAVCREAVFGDLRRPPQFYPRGKWHRFELYGPLAKYLSRKF